MTEGKRDERRHELHDGSDELMAALDEIRDLERRKRMHPTSSADFRQLAIQVEAQSRSIFHLAIGPADRGGAQREEASTEDGLEECLHGGPATSAEPSDGGGRTRSAAATAWTSTWRSMRSSRGPETRA